MILKYYDQKIKCAKAVKGVNYIKLYDGNNGEVANFTGIGDFSGFELVGGVWSNSEPTEAERLASAEKAILTLMGAM